MTHPASLAQIRAANPGQSTWLSANAGSGKTRVLTGRVAWLMLEGVAPERILCLTYTKAAAGEMQNRLFAQLGEWAMLDDGPLQEKLAEMGVPAASFDAARLDHARTLFARAIEAPGGLKIQTIHAFCASLLRRFPLEAGVSPQFKELDERSQKLIYEDVLNLMAEGPEQPLLDGFLHRISDQTAEKMCAAVLRARAHFTPAPSVDTIRTAFDLPQGLDLQGLPELVLTPEVLRALGDIREAIKGDTGAKMIRLSEVLAPLDLTQPSPEGLEALWTSMLTQARTPVKSPLNKGPLALLGQDLIDMLQQVALDALDLRRRITTAAWTRALHSFAPVFIARIEAEKAARGALDFEDMIQKTRALLSHPEVAQWVLYRLDGGIDHILVDEAQDTSPAQWDVITALAGEFYADRENTERRMFVVGDKKQSIYSFQGADPAQFDTQRDRFQARFDAVGSPFAALELRYSFRSAPAILRLVDQVFAHGRGPGVGEEVAHQAFFDQKPGRITLWDAIEPVPKAKEERLWSDPVDQVASNHHSVTLARQVAQQIQEMLAARTPIQVGQVRRPVEPGDILILVQRRSEVFEQIITACKEAGLPLAGADVMKISGETAVRDLTALLKFLALPEDDLSLAAVLRAPLFGWSEDDLFGLAHDRGALPLWAALRNRAETYPETHAILRDLRNLADYLPPYELLDRMLTRHDGRRKLLARLGAEAEEGIDALLAQALAYERAEVPSLDGFIVWLEADEVKIKRQADGSGALIRVMTVHGAKGLEAPVVILPETEVISRPNRGVLIPGPGEVLAWKPGKDDTPETLLAAAQAQEARDAEERDRLLYVALTRAESWLIVWGAGSLGKEPQDCWYGMIQAAMHDLGALRDIGRLELIEGDWETPAETRKDDQPQTVDLPLWLEAPAPPKPTRPQIQTPSRLGGAKALGGEGLSQEAALERGTLIHALLEHLPNVARPERTELARHLLRQRLVDPDQHGDIIAEAAAVLDAPDLAPIFAPDTLAEVAFSAPPLPGGDAPLYGIIDRLIVTETSVQIIDFKSNAQVPTHPQEVPLGLLRQMAAYAHGIATAYPGRKIILGILWTRTATLMELPHDLVMNALATPLDG